MLGQNLVRDNFTRSKRRLFTQRYIYICIKEDKIMLYSAGTMLKGSEDNRKKPGVAHYNRSKTIV